MKPLQRGPWTPEEDAILRELYPDTPNRQIAEVIGRNYTAVKNRSIRLQLKKSKAYMAKGPGCFRKGHQTWNKGVPFRSGGRSVESQFKPGQKPANALPVGTEKVDTYGYLKRKVKDDAPRGKGYKNWRFVHVLIWEESNGPLPDGYVVRFRDGDRTNLSPGNLAAIHRSENAVMNKMYKPDGLPAEGFDVMLNMARLRMTEKKLRKEKVA